MDVSAARSALKSEIAKAGWQLTGVVIDAAFSSCRIEFPSTDPAATAGFQVAGARKMLEHFGVSPDHAPCIALKDIPRG